MAPKVSVLIPTYNYAQFLPEAIGAVQAQDFRDFELLIVDDCSQDNSAEVAAKFSANDPRIRLSVNAANLGMVENWNHCLALAKGEYVKFLFGDDKLMGRQALGSMAAMLDQHPKAALAASARIVLDEKSNWIDLLASLPDGAQPGPAIITRCLLQNHNLIGEPSVVMFRRADAQRGFDRGYRQMVDLEMWFHLLERGDLVYTREPLCAFRRHAGQQTAVNNANRSSAEQFNEQLMLVRTYGAKPWISTRQRLDILYRARRGLWKNPTAKSQFLALERQSAGPSGLSRYFLPWLKYTFARPAENLKRSWQKRRFQWSMKIRKRL